MGDKTGIAWTDATWNPFSPWCSKVSPGCANCYAETLSLRMGWTPKPWTPGNLEENSKGRLYPTGKRLSVPLHWRRPRRIFVNSMGDLFHEWIPDDAIGNVFSVMAECPRHIFQVLTKRPQRMYEWCTRYMPQPLPNVALGTSTENQRTLTQRLPWLLDTPARWRFLSCEPLLGTLSLLAVPAMQCRRCWGEGSYQEGDLSYATAVHNVGKGVDIARKYTVVCPDCRGRGHTDELHWVIVGGESGAGYRPMDPESARQIRDDCRRMQIPFFYKQGASLRPGQDDTLDGERYHEFPREWAGHLGLEGGAAA